MAVHFPNWPTPTGGDQYALSSDSIDLALDLAMIESARATERGPLFVDMFTSAPTPAHATR